MGVKANKRRGHAAEAEAARLSQEWPDRFHMQRTGLDGGHDLTGEECIGEVKAVKTGPVWLKDGLAQLGRITEDGKQRLLLVKLSQGPGKPTRWLVIQDLDQWEDYVAWAEASAEGSAGRSRGTSTKR